MRNSIIILIFLFTNSLFSESTPKDSLFQSAQRSVCFIKIIQEIEGNSEFLSSGCGVILKDDVEDKIFYCFATAYHVIEPLIKMRNTYASVKMYDQNGYRYSTKNVNLNNIIWKDKSADAALVLIPSKVSIIGDRPEGYKYPGLHFLKSISVPDWGEEVYLIGYRLIDSNTYLYIIKKGIVSSMTTTLPGYLGNSVFLVDNMANKGMSGGLVINSLGKGLSVISGYILEKERKVQTSDDLTVSLSLDIFYNKMKSQKDVVKKLLKENAN